MTVPVPTVTVENKIDPVVYVIPMPPTIPALNFVTLDGGVWLTADDGRLLALYIVDMRAYQDKLNLIVEHYSQD